jgi:hypothetical protein
MPVDTVTLSFRAERELVDRLGAVLEEMRRAVPGARLKLSDAIRATLFEGLTLRDRKKRRSKR